MAMLPTRSDFVCQALRLLGIQTERLKEVHIHIEPEDMVRAECIYYLEEPPLFSIEEFETVVKKYELHFKEIKTE